MNNPPELQAANIRQRILIISNNPHPHPPIRNNRNLPPYNSCL